MRTKRTFTMKENVDWMKLIGDYLCKECKARDVDYIFMPFVSMKAASEDDDSNRPAGLLTTFKGIQASVAAAVLLGRLYRTQHMNEKMDKKAYKQWVRKIANASGKVYEDSFHEKNEIFKRSA